MDSSSVIQRILTYCIENDIVSSDNTTQAEMDDAIQYICENGEMSTIFEDIIGPEINIFYGYHNGVKNFFLGAPLITTRINGDENDYIIEHDDLNRIEEIKHTIYNIVQNYRHLVLDNNIKMYNISENQIKLYRHYND
jgi:hypothetical protein